MTALLSVDIAAKPVGSFFGGKFSLSVPCPTCGRPALMVRKTINNGKTVKQFAHHASFTLNARNEPEVSYGVVCEHGAT